MGTRALIRVFEGNQELICIYRQYDGHPDRLGAELAEFIESKRVTNGIAGSDCFNGTGCFAARLVGHLKEDKPGNVYIYPIGTKDCGEEYEYHVHGPKPCATTPIKLEAFERNFSSGELRKIKLAEKGN